MLAGPNMICDVRTILIRYRRFDVTLMGDVTELFLRVKLEVDDQKYHRFLWRNKDTNELIIFQWKSHVFGNKGSPTVAIFAAKNNAKRYASQFPIESEIIQESSCVDDNLDSCHTPQQAVTRLKNITHIFSKVGMKVTKYSSNSEEVLASFDPKDLARSMKDLDFS